MFVNKKLTILYGSQTGNAQDLAERIWRESKRFFFNSCVKAMDDYNILQLTNEPCVIFVCSTTGQGEEPSNMRNFWRFLLKKNLPPDSLISVRFSVFGLGDSSYSKYNFTAKKLYKRLLQLGGQPIIPLGLGDDQHDLGYDAAADPWIESLWSNLLSIYPLPANVQPLEKNYPILPRYSLTTSSSLNFITPQSFLYYSTKSPSDFSVTVVENKRATDSDHFQDVRLLKFKTEGQSYSPGDVIALRPKNFSWQIEEFKNILIENNVIIEDDFIFNLKQTDPNIPVPDVLKNGATFKQLCEDYFDLMAIPRRSTFSILAQITDSPLEKEKCLEFTTAEGQNDLYTYCNRPKRNIVEVLQDFPNATKNLTKELLFDILPPIRPREFSIASSFKKHTNEIHILMAVVKYKTKLKKERYGLCSNYLANLNEGDKILANLKKGSFRFPQDDVPVIMVGPGTGVAPFRNYINERIAHNLGSKNVVLFFGCRYKNKDFLCGDEFLDFHQKGLMNLICAFSREQENKVYVQDKILEHKDVVWDLLEKGSYVFVAGSAKSMPQEVRKAFLSVCEECGGMTSDQAENFIKNMEKKNKYQTEVWS